MEENINLQNLVIKKQKPEFYKLGEEIVNKNIKLCIGKIITTNCSATCFFAFLRQLDIKIIITNNHVISQENLKLMDKLDILTKKKR